MTKTNNLQPEELENLTATINQYVASQTSSALSKLLSEPVDYNVIILEKEFFNFRNIKLASDEIQMCTVRLNGRGDTHIEICYAIKMKYAKQIAEKLLQQPESDEISELGTSAIQEVANILTGSFFNALSSTTGFRVELSTPDYQQGNLDTFVTGSAKDILNPNPATIVTDAELVGKTSGIRLHMLIMQDESNVRKLLKQLDKSQKKEFNKLTHSKEVLSDLEDSKDVIHNDLENPELDALVDQIQKEEFSTK